MQNNTFGERLRAERKRLNMNQDDFAAVGGVKKLAQVTYEQDKRFPDAGYLIAVAAIGVDTEYVLSGKINAEALNKDEQELVEGFRSLDARGKAGVLGMISGMSAPQAIGGATIHGKVGQQIVGDITGPNTVNMSGKKSKK
ncbi:helix-turn-helix domain-containing protein [Undibacterium sp.]|uniref:helix-turn-helix domain-containing protein n=1 Tax=Undibacterium sp. TaxID=1914977 RepID=UPI002731E48E|nr:helix-turn-helix transcriptional regulator [Undibacterium sp.]MDP1979224.1 helix-turn-helix transcriptional regulator [Undibacterium sp.]